MKNLRKVFWLLLPALFLFPAYPLSAQQWIPNFKHYTIRDGLPSSEVYQITSDAQKNLWFVTDRGVVKYDGYSFRVYDNKDSLPENSVIKVYKDWKTRIWFISFTGLLSYYENGKIVPYKYNSVISSKLGISIFTSLYVDEHESVFLNGIEGKIHSIDSAGRYSENILRADTVTFIINDTSQATVSTFFASTVNFKPPTRLTIKSSTQSFDILLNQYINYQHFGTTKLRNGDLIFYCGRVLIRIRPDRSYKVKYLEAPALDVFEDSRKDLWIGCYHDGVYVYDSSMTVSSHYLTDFSVSHIYADYEGGMWISTLENGIFYLPSRNNLSFAIGDHVLREKITAIENISDSVLIFATSKGILYKFNAFSFTIDRIDFKKEISRAAESINSLFYIESKKLLVIGTNPIYNSPREKISIPNWHGFKLISSYSSTRFILQDDNHLLGSEYFFSYSFNIDNLSNNFINKKNFHATALFKDARGRLMAGGLDGLYIYIDSNFVLFDSTKNILRKRVTDITELNNSYLVIATRSNGIILLSDAGLNNITALDGLSSDNINRISVEGNIIWASTNRGLNKITIKNQKPLRINIEYYNFSNGLLSDEINDFAIGKNKIYAATNEGLSLVSEEEPVHVIKDIPFYIKAVKINDRDTLLTSSYSLNHKQNTLNISFSAVSFSNSKNITYRYRLLGQDTIWRNTSNRDVQFTNLPWGTYKFQLHAATEKGLIAKTPLEIAFILSPPFYETIWFRAIVVLSVIIILFLLLNLRIRNIKRKADERNELNRKFSELNLNALRSQMNPHFTFNVLNSIQYYIAKKDSESAQLYITKFARLIRMILDQSRTEFISLAEEIKTLTLYIELEELRFEKKFTYSIHVDASLNTADIYIPGMLVQPFVENSIKHGIRFKKGEAYVDINFRTSDSILICTITDNGIGRNEASKLKSSDEEFKSVGTDIVRDRIEALGILFNGMLKNYTSDLTDEQGNPTGTCVTVEVPFKTL